MKELITNCFVIQAICVWLKKQLIIVYDHEPTWGRISAKNRFNGRMAYSPSGESTAKQAVGGLAGIGFAALRRPVKSDSDPVAALRRISWAVRCPPPPAGTPPTWGRISAKNRFNGRMAYSPSGESTAKQAVGGRAGIGFAALRRAEKYDNKEYR